MKYVIYPVAILTVCLSMSLAAAQNKVVVIPLNSCNDSNLVSENICLGVTICGVTGTRFCTRDSYGTITSAGQVWMDRNLGASRVATSMTDAEAYGGLYQWGRLTDGHEQPTSPTNPTLSPNDVPGHGSFILTSSSPYDWRTPQHDNLWQGESGINNPCPAGFRLPTETEWVRERASWGSNNSAGAFASPLKLVLAGSRGGSSGTLVLAGSYGNYWSSTVDGSDSGYLYFNSGGAGFGNEYRSDGYSVRCIKD